MTRSGGRLLGVLWEDADWLASSKPEGAFPIRLQGWHPGTAGSCWRDPLGESCCPPAKETSWVVTTSVTRDESWGWCPHAVSFAGIRGFTWRPGVWVPEQAQLLEGGIKRRWELQGRFLVTSEAVDLGKKMPAENLSLQIQRALQMSNSHGWGGRMTWNKSSAVIISNVGSSLWRPSFHWVGQVSSHFSNFSSIKWDQICSLK